MTPLSEREHRALFRRKLVGEIFYALGLQREGIARRWLGPVFSAPATRIAAICVRADAAVLQFLLQGIRPERARLRIHLSFGEPVEARALLAADPMPAVAAIDRGLLARPMADLNPARPRSAGAPRADPALP